MLHLIGKMLAIEDALFNDFYNRYMAGLAIAPREVVKIPTELVKCAEIPNVLSARELRYMGIDSVEAADGLIAVITIRGTMQMYDDWYQYGTENLIQQLMLADGNVAVKSIILRVDSGGGELAGSEQLAMAVKGMKKPKIGSGKRMAASAAYWAFSQCDECYIEDSLTAVGSIGTMGIYRDIVSANEKAGIHYKILRSAGSEDKAALNGLESLDGEFQQVALGQEQKVLDDSRKVFLASVRANRPRVSESIGGGIFYGKDAVNQGLVNSLMSFDGVLKRANVLGSLAKK